MTDYEELQRSIAPIRITRYIQACDGDVSRATKEYFRNIDCGGDLLKLILIFETILRHHIDQHLQSKLGDNWLINLADLSRGLLTINTHQPDGDTYSTSHNLILSHISFGFWRKLFDEKIEAQLSWYCADVFSDKLATNTNRKRKLVFNMLTNINQVRNRICHCEPINLKHTDSGNSVDYQRVLQVISQIEILTVAMCGFCPRKLAALSSKLKDTIKQIPQCAQEPGTAGITAVIIA